MPKKKVQSSQTRQTRQVKSVHSKAATRYQNTLKAIKDKYGVDHRTAQSAYRHLRDSLPERPPSRVTVVQHPRLTSKSVRTAKNERVRERRAAKGREAARVSSKRAIEAAIQQLEEQGPSIRGHITSRSFDPSSMLVKISIKGKDYTRTIKGRITEIKGSKILGWKWNTIHSGKHHK